MNDIFLIKNFRFILIIFILDKIIEKQVRWIIYFLKRVHSLTNSFIIFHLRLHFIINEEVTRVTIHYVLENSYFLMMDTL